MTRPLTILLLVLLCGCSAPVAKQAAQMPPMPKAEVRQLASTMHHGFMVVTNGCAMIYDWQSNYLQTVCPYPAPPKTVFTLAWLYDTNAPLPWTNVWGLQTSTDLKHWETLFALTSWQTMYQFTNNEPQRFFRMAKVGAIGR